MTNIDLDWISYRATQSYPLADDVSGISRQGVPIDDSLILDITIYIPSQFQVQYNQFYIKTIKDQTNTLSFIIGYKGLDCMLSTGIPKTIGMTQAISDRYFILAPVRSEQFQWFSKLTGSITVGNTIEYVAGTLSFNVQESRLNRACITVLNIKRDAYIQSINVGDDVLTGQITLQAQNGVVLQVQDNTIKIMLDDSYIQTLVDQRMRSLGQPILTLNGQKPDEQGNINIDGADCVSVSPSGIGTIVISNPCAKPCCDSGSTDNLQSAVQVIKAQQQVLMQYFTNMANNVNYMQSNLSTLMSN